MLTFFRMKQSQIYRLIFVLTCIEALASPELAQKKAFNTPEGNTQRRINIYTSIEVEEMIEDYWESLGEEF